MSAHRTDFWESLKPDYDEIGIKRKVVNGIIGYAEYANRNSELTEHAQTDLLNLGEHFSRFDAKACTTTTCQGHDGAYFYKDPINTDGDFLVFM